ncbi:MAG: hypothetical protein A2161_12220 [Candidatus Schekmanbacteria bacterium RBG_13_48_7]|uniref:Uncharacterized protein n=1 Tax=Candidatus Schekmanbacteria bacterium RBG_13_48_7 TaxID=1817878 RepID=A0A1F7RJ59_9BACT|nr:MAG: hypothetical protein A2161_12220 [Candidatus Schekmanbacteria bacterium RBG_13_48_7]
MSWLKGSLSVVALIFCVIFLWNGCDFLGFNDENEPNIPGGNGDAGSLLPTPTPPGGPGAPSATPTVRGGGGADLIVSEPGVRREINLGNVSAGTFHFEVRGFDPNRYGGDHDQLKPVYFWLYNGVYDYECSGLLFEVRQLLYANYWCIGGKIKGRNGGSWRGELCYSVTWERDHWYSIDVTWGGGVIALYIDGYLKERMNIGNVNGTVIAGLGWPPARREGIIGLEYRNMGMR